MRGWWFLCPATGKKAHGGTLGGLYREGSSKIAAFSEIAECGTDANVLACHWQGWYRHITLAMLAHAVLAILRARGEKKPPTRSTSACPNCAPCSSECCGADGTALNISSIGPHGEDDIHSTPCAATIENAAHRCQSSIYNCSTKLNDFFLATCIPTIQKFHWTSVEPKPHFPT